MIKLIIIVLALIGGVVGLFGLIPLLTFALGYFTCVWVAIVDDSTNAK